MAYHYGSPPSTFAECRLDVTVAKVVNGEGSLKGISATGGINPLAYRHKLGGCNMPHTVHQRAAAFSAVRDDEDATGPS